jgi:hypothetical protein
MRWDRATTPRTWPWNDIAPSAGARAQQPRGLPTGTRPCWQCGRHGSSAQLATRSQCPALGEETDGTAAIMGVCNQPQSQRKDAAVLRQARIWASAGSGRRRMPKPCVRGRWTVRRTGATRQQPLRKESGRQLPIRRDRCQSAKLGNNRCEREAVDSCQSDEMNGRMAVAVVRVRRKVDRQTN